MSENYNGALQYEENELIIFDEGIIGFDEYRKYLPIPIEEGSDLMVFLQCVENEELAFLMMNPFMVKGDYDPKLTESEMKLMGTDKDEDLSFYVMCAVKEPMNESTVNLKCPIVVNALTRHARQVVLEDERYKFRHTLAEISSKEEA